MNRLLFLTLFTAVSSQAADFYVSPTGSSGNNGSLNSPWDLQTALNHPSAVKPGDTIWLRGGQYTGLFTSRLTGTAASYITVRQYAGERAILASNVRGDGINTLTQSGAYVNFWGFELMNTVTQRITDNVGSNHGETRPSGSVTDPNGAGHHNRFINLLIHDNGSGIGFWSTNVADDSEMYGNIIFNNGWKSTKDRPPYGGHGHGVYGQNRYGVKRLTDNIAFNGYNQGLQIYGSGDNSYINNFIVEGNMVFNSGILQGDFERNVLFGGGITCVGHQIMSNFLYMPLTSGQQSLNVGYNSDLGCDDVLVKDNYIAGATVMANNKNLSLIGNTFIGSIRFDPTNTPSNSLSGYPGNINIPYGTRPTGTRVFVRPNRFEPGRGHIAVYNWDRLDTVSLDLSSIMGVGTAYEIRDVQNYFGAPVLTGTYTGGNVTVTLPGTGSPVMTPVGNAPVPPHTDKEFNVFVVLPAGSVVAPPPPPPPPAQVATPTISPNGGAFTSAQSVTLACATSGAEIRYTTNGQDPTSVSALYTTPFSLSASATVKAKAFKSGVLDSPIASAVFSITTGGGGGGGGGGTTNLPPPPTINFPTGGNQFYVSPTGLATNNGSINSPWNLPTALAHPSAVKPGDTIWLRGGRYTHVTKFFSQLTGTADKPILVRQYPGERATLDGLSWDRVLEVKGAHTWYMDFEVMSSVNSRGGISATGLWVEAPNTRFINLVVHDVKGGYGLWINALNAEVYGNVIYHSGYGNGCDGRGHNLYVQNLTDNTKYIRDNVMLQSYSFGIHGYGQDTQSGGVDNLWIEGNTLFNHGMAAGCAKGDIVIGPNPGPHPAQNPYLYKNMTYMTAGNGGRATDFKYDGCNNPTINNNYFVADTAINLDCTNVNSVNGNTFYGNLSLMSASSYPSNTYATSRPTSGLQVFVRPNLYESGRANITIYNWSKAPTVQVDVAGIGLQVGDAYEIRYAQNYFGPTQTGTYNGQPITITMSGWTTVAPNEGTAPPSTLPEFGAFVIKKPLGGGAPPPPPPTPTTVATPTISPNGGTFTSAQSVTLQTTTPGATIRYTTNGSDPTSASTAYTGPLTVSTNQTIKARGFASGMTDSAVASASFAFTTPPPPGSAFELYLEAEAATLTAPMVSVNDTNASGGRYTTSPVGNQGTDVWSFTVPQAGTYYVWGRVLAPDSGRDSFFVLANGGAEDVYDAAENRWSTLWQWTRVNGRGGSSTPNAIPIRPFDLPAGANTLSFRVRDANSSVDRIYITNDPQRVPSDSAPPPPPPPPSSQVATPTISPNGGTFTSAQSVTLQTTTSGAAIRYTTNGSDPTSASTLYAAPFSVATSQTIKARAFASGMTDSSIATAVFTIAPPTNLAPTVTQAAGATPSPVTGTTTNVSVRAADDGGEPSLTYTWGTSGTPPAIVNFSPNGTNAAKNSVATFSKVGTYSLQVTVRDVSGLTVTSNVTVVVSPTLTTISVTPPLASVGLGQTQTFAASSADQFGQAMSPTPSFTWTTTGGGTINSAGLFTAGSSAGGPFTITAASGGKTGTANVTVVNGAPAVATPASAAPAPVTATTTNLSVLGADDGGAGNLIYTWATSGTPPAAVTYSANGTNAARNTTVTFNRAGNYSFTVTIRDAAGLSVTSSVNVAVNQTLSAITVAPPVVSVQVNQSQTFSATGLDQFNQAMTPAPSFNWTTTGGGAINSAGLFTAGASAGGPFTITAASAGRTGTARVTVIAAPNNPPTVATPAAASPSPVNGTTTNLSVLGADDAGEAALTYHWSVPTGVTLSANDSNGAKNTVATFSQAGTYSFQVSIQDANGQSVVSSVNVTVSQTLEDIVISPATVNVTVNASQTFSSQAFDQFGQPMASLPTLTWTVTGGGSINSAGLFTAGSAAGGPFTVRAQSGAVTGTATLSVTVSGNNAPTVALPAWATPNPATGANVALAVLGADDGGESNLTYTWAAIGNPPGLVSFSSNGTNVSKNTLATFIYAGQYTFQVIIREPGGLTTQSQVTVNIQPTVSRVLVSPPFVSLSPNVSQQFDVLLLDQFNQAMSATPAVLWSVTGGGQINASGRFTASDTPGGPYVVSATVGAQSDYAYIIIPGTPGDGASGELPDPNLLGLDRRVLSVRDNLAFDYPVPNVNFEWSLEPVSAGVSTQSALAKVRGTAASIRAFPVTTAPRLSLSDFGLPPGDYLLRVTVSRSGASANAKTATAYVTLVSADLDGIKVYPNPWRADRHSSQDVLFDNLSLGTTIKIFTISGHRVQEISATGSQARWNRQNDSGQTVASGIYIYLAEDSSGAQKKGKIAIIK